MSSPDSGVHVDSYVVRRLTVVGPGKLGSAFSRALSRSGWELGRVFGRGDELASGAAEEGVLLLSVPDGALSMVAQQIDPGPALVVHASGFHTLDPLSPHQRVGSVHPLLSLPDAETGSRLLTSGGVFAISGDRGTEQIVADLNGTSVTVPNADRARYHATAAVASNHLVAICDQVQALASLTGVPFEAYLDLMRATLDNVENLGPRSALTGPASRGDWATIEAHLASLPAEQVDLYWAGCQRAASMAGLLPPSTLASAARTASQSPNSQPPNSQGPDSQAEWE